MARQKFLSLATLLVTATAGCQGTIGDPGAGNADSPGSPGRTGGAGSGMTGNGGRPPIGNPAGGSTGAGGSGGGSTTTPPTGTPPDPLAAGPMPLRRLTIREYNNTVRDLLGDPANRGSSFTLDKDSDFLFHRAGVVASGDADNLKDAAEATAAAAAPKLMTMFPCVGGNEETCAASFISDFGLRAYRRPVAMDEAKRLTDLYHTGRMSLALDYPGAIQLLIEAILQSPAFLYHWELGNNAPTVEGKVIHLSPYETASRLSYFIWGSMPDQALFDAAKNSKLASAQDLQDQAKRMLADPKARDTVQDFADEWLTLDLSDRPKDAVVYPEYNDALKAAMANELHSFVSNVVFDGDSRLTTLLMGTNTFVNGPLASVYGLSGVSGNNMVPADLDVGQRAGILTRAEFLAVTGATNGSHPVKRGRRIYERFLCGVLPPPPNNVPPAKPPTAAGTTRQHFEEHDHNPCAGACHALMDPPGFAFEHYDGIGKYRMTDNGMPVDSSGQLDVEGDNMPKPFNDARDLSKILSASESVAQCFATQWLRYAFKRPEVDADRASLESMDGTFAKANSIKDLMVGLVGTRTFRYRAPGAGEMLQ